MSRFSVGIRRNDILLAFTMCGIAGCLSRDGRPADVEIVRAMGRALRHRGPDGEGSLAWPSDAPRVALAMRRLAILDLVTGDQPVFSEDRRIAVVSNGEIYNYVELRDQLAARGHAFRSTGDTEVLVHLYEEHGLELFRYLRGMYALALWDATRERLVLAVDHLGIKPLYLHETGSEVRFASEAKALLADPRLRRTPRLDALDTYLTFGYPIGEDSLVEGIERLPPATAVVYERGHARRLRHWTAPVPDPAAPLVPQPAAAVRGWLEEAVRLHLRSDVPTGVFLSGGVDSAGLVALVRAGGHTVRTFTLGYTGVEGNALDEAARAAEVAAWAGAEHTELRLTPDDWWNTLGAFVVAHDEPNANPSMVSLQALARVASRSVKVVLNGTGGDEVFGGYPAHVTLPRLMRQQAWAGRSLPPLLGATLNRALAVLEPSYPALRRVPVAARVPALASGARAALLPAAEGLRRVASFEALVLTDWQRRQMYGPAVAEAWRGGGHAAATYRALLAEAQQPGGSYEELAQRLVMRTWLPGNGLLAIDKVTMAHGLEARVPYFDRTFVERVLALPQDVRLRAGKGLLRDALAPLLPDHWRGRPKQPFEAPLRQWLERDLAPRVREVLLDPGARIRALFNIAHVERILRRHRSRRAEHAELILRLLVLELWWRAVLEG
jgi:asparagine synthase (glutamine-hydrolysing)